MKWPDVLAFFLAIFALIAALTGAINTPATPDPVGWPNQIGERP